MEASGNLLESTPTVKWIHDKYCQLTVCFPPYLPIPEGGTYFPFPGPGTPPIPNSNSQDHGPEDFKYILTFFPPQNSHLLFQVFSQNLHPGKSPKVTHRYFVLTSQTASRPNFRACTFLVTDCPTEPGQQENNQLSLDLANIPHFCLHLIDKTAS